MLKSLSKPILYLITQGATTETTAPDSPEFQNILLQIKAAAEAQIELVQIREKRLSARVLFELARHAVEITRESPTRVMINDRADIAAGAGAHGVHLTTESLDAAVIRKHFDKGFLIGVSTHSSTEVRRASEQDADLVVFGPVFPTPGKEQYGAAQGVQRLAEVCRESTLPVLALGGISKRNALECFEAGASGIAGISLFSEPATLNNVAAAIRQSTKGEFDEV